MLASASQASAGPKYISSHRASCDRDRDRLPGSTRAAVPDRITEDLADQQDRHIPARVPRAENLRDERAGGTGRP